MAIYPATDGMSSNIWPHLHSSPILRAPVICLADRQDLAITQAKQIEKTRSVGPAMRKNGSIRDPAIPSTPSTIYPPTAQAYPQPPTQSDVLAQTPLQGQNLVAVQSQPQLHMRPQGPRRSISILTAAQHHYLVNTPLVDISPLLEPGRASVWSVLSPGLGLRSLCFCVRADKQDTTQLPTWKPFFPYTPDSHL